MSKLRFTYEYVDDKFYDKGFFLDNGKRMFKDEVLNTLNKLEEENKRLKEHNDKLMKQPLLFDVQTIPNTMEILEANTQLEEENEQLKSTIKDLRIGVLDSIHESYEIKCTCNPCVVEECVKKVVEMNPMRE